MINAVQIALAIILPLLAGILHPEVREALAASRWPTALGFLLGFSGIYALIALGAVIFFLIKKRMRASWLAIGLLTLLSGATAVSSRLIQQRVQAMSDGADSAKLTGWMASTGKEVVFSLKTSGFVKSKTERLIGKQFTTLATDGLSVTGQIQNNSPERLYERERDS